MLVTIGKKYSYQKARDRYFLWIMQWRESQSTRGLNTPMAYFSKHANSTRDFASLLVRFQMDMDRSKVPLCNRNLGTRNARVLTRDQSMTQVERRRIDVEVLCYFIRSTTSLTLATFTVSEASITRSTSQSHVHERAGSVDVRALIYETADAKGGSFCSP